MAKKQDALIDSKRVEYTDGNLLYRFYRKIYIMLVFKENSNGLGTVLAVNFIAF